MGNSGDYDSVDYTQSVQQLRATGTVHVRSQRAQATGSFNDIADCLDPRKLKNGIRESCYMPGKDDILPIAVSIDATGSMDEVPVHLQAELAKLIDVLIEQGVSEAPHLMFMVHDDEYAHPIDAVFQMSQFEIGSKQLLEMTNEAILPGHGYGNNGEAYHLSIYAVANHTRLESFERHGEAGKGFFFIIGDEEPYYGAKDGTKNGTSPEVAKEVFGDVIEREVTMLESLKRAAGRYHVFVIRPGHTSNGKDRRITALWQKLFRAAGLNPEYVMEIPETDAIISTMAMTIGRVVGQDEEDIAQALTVKGADGVAAARKATRDIVPVATARGAVVQKLDTGAAEGRARA